jgi:hypothetical protein
MDLAELNHVYYDENFVGRCVVVKHRIVGDDVYYQITWDGDEWWCAIVSKTLAAQAVDIRPSDLAEYLRVSAHTWYRLDDPGFDCPEIPRGAILY